MNNIKKTFFILLLAIFLGLSSVTATKALLQDTETSFGNTVKGATINLRVGDTDPSTFAFNFNNVTPGEIHQFWVEVAKDGGIGGNFWMEVDSSNSLELENPEGETEITGEGELDDCAEVQIIFDDDMGTEVLALPFTPVKDIVNPIDQNLSSIDSLVDGGARMNLQLRTDLCGSEAMGDAFDLDLSFYLEQV
jgi:hypothetical protein